MSHPTPTLKAEVRERIGTRYSQRLRKSGKLPAIIYGHGQAPVAIAIDQSEVLSHLHHGAHLFSIDIAGSGTETCLVNELQFGYLGDDVIHLDFTRVDLDEEVEVAVHLKFVGTPEAAKKPGAVLTHDLTELEIICKANNIPEEIRVDLSKMTEVFTVAELKLPEGVRTDIDPEHAVAHIDFIEEEDEGEAAEVSGSAEPEVITERKDEEGDED